MSRQLIPNPNLIHEWAGGSSLRPFLCRAFWLILYNSTLAYSRYRKHTNDEKIIYFVLNNDNELFHHLRTLRIYNSLFEALLMWLIKEARMQNTVYSLIYKHSQSPNRRVCNIITINCLLRSKTKRQRITLT